ncbi:dihydroorotase [Jannaschia sp. CCS1]|uniref:Dihydroorotase n=1 Tax=Jannaschia sp. (strain CCS1) TaxID=290400 RepID=PYRC_JANSC|nr:dihydroorotase [Jannaschia sp. CCS1]Q28RK3.1 RecName: Full=Dihydroorotase; Short=DHOase [Jannaschia sp. CCS1]ABD54659.1 dihydroorotase [Jannaschia sp. CCS1]
MTQSLTIRRPDDWHLHLRDGAMMRAVLPETARHFARAIIMPNLVPPVVTAQDALAYRDRIEAALPDGADFTPLMTLYLTEQTDPDDVEAAFADGLIHAVKLYPAGATTNSQSGVATLKNVYPVLERMAQIGLPLCIHGEVTDPQVDIFDREQAFIDTVLIPLRADLPDLKVTLEHITTSHGIDYVVGADGDIAGTITTHHLMINRNHMLVGGIRPHYYCLPIVKRASHQHALRRAATSGHPRFFLGTDSAPHLDGAKETACGCAGVFSATNTMSCLAHVFDEDGALVNLEAFTSLNGPARYGLAPNAATMTLEKRDHPTNYPAKFDTDDGPLTLFDPSTPLYWHVKD